MTASNVSESVDYYYHNNNNSNNNNNNKNKTKGKLYSSDYHAIDINLEDIQNVDTLLQPYEMSSITRTIRQLAVAATCLILSVLFNLSILAGNIFIFIIIIILYIYMLSNTRKSAWNTKIS